MLYYNQENSNIRFSATAGQITYNWPNNWLLHLQSYIFLISFQWKITKILYQILTILSSVIFDFLWEIGVFYMRCVIVYFAWGVLTESSCSFLCKIFKL